ncbi:hypothetical protein V494_02193 [Pseudogymnoascus sp. VKM F-4513 (FW-928)]|nr:hypothetical protein V494_02193 [Pseudogymnoascus sp. VKM F-4513 (FW-928)]
MNPRLRRKAHPALAIRVPWHPKRDGPAKAAGGGKLEAEVIVKASDGVVVLVDYKEVSTGCEVAVVEAVEGGEGQRRGRVRVVGGGLEVGEVAIFGPFVGGRGGFFWGAPSTLPVAG